MLSFYKSQGFFIQTARNYFSHPSGAKWFYVKLSSSGKTSLSWWPRDPSCVHLSYQVVPGCFNKMQQSVHVAHWRDHRDGWQGAIPQLATVLCSPRQEAKNKPNAIKGARKADAKMCHCQDAGTEKTNSSAPSAVWAHWLHWVEASLLHRHQEDPQWISQQAP